METLQFQPAGSSRGQTLDADRNLRRLIKLRLGTLTGGLKLRVADGMVQVAGNVPSRFSKQQVLLVVRSTPGVHQVQSLLTVEPPLQGRHEPLEFFQSPLPRLCGALGLTMLLCSLAWLCVGSASLRLEHPQVKFVVNGHPAAGAQLVLHPMPAPEAQQSLHAPFLPPTSGTVRADGTVEWTTQKRGDGIPRGRYVVTAHWHRLVTVEDELLPGPNVLPRTLALPEQSPLKLEALPESQPVQLLSVELTHLGGPSESRRIIPRQEGA